MLNFLSVTLWGAKLRKLTEKHFLMDRNKISKTLLFGLSVGRNNLMHLKVSCSFLGFISSLNWFSWAFQLLRHLSFKSNLLAHTQWSKKKNNNDSATPLRTFSFFANAKFCFQRNLFYILYYEALRLKIMQLLPRVIKILLRKEFLRLKKKKYGRKNFTLTYMKGFEIVRTDSFPFLL